MVGAGLNAEVAGPVVSDSIIHRIWGRAAPCPLPGHSHRPRWTLRSCGSGGAGRPGCPGCSSGSLRSLWTRGAGGASCTGRARVAFLGQLAPEARAGIGLMVGAGLNAEVAGPVVSDSIIHRIWGRAAPRPLPGHSHRPRWTLRSCGSGGAGRPGRPSGSLRSLWARRAGGTSGTGRARVALLGQLAPEA